jgi:LacI family transcriptional regulator
MRKRKKPHLPEVLLLVETSTGYGRGILEGIGRYVRERGPWLISFERRGQADLLPRWLRKWQGDGIIARSGTSILAKTVRATGLPVVELGGERQAGVAAVHADNRAVGRLAAQHLLDCGLRQFGFFAFGEAWWTALLRDGFCQTLAEQGHVCAVYQPRGTRSLLPEWSGDERRTVTAWLRGLPRPMGVFTCGPEHALFLLDVCRKLGIAVPEQIAILPSGDDPLIYNMTTPPLSGVDSNPARIGYEAAALLDRMMDGQSSPDEPLWIPPARVVARQSTDILAIADAEVAQAVRFIREHACRGIDVPQVATAISLSRRVLERRFHEHLGRTPKDEIVRVCIERAKLLLNQSDATVESIGKNSGFASFKHFAEIFRREVGTTPRQFRREQKMR